MMMNQKYPPEGVRAAGRTLISDADFERNLQAEMNRVNYILSLAPQPVLPPLIMLRRARKRDGQCDMAAVPILGGLPDAPADLLEMLHNMGRSFATMEPDFYVVAAYFSFMHPTLKRFADRNDSAAILGETLDGRQNDIYCDCVRNEQGKVCAIKEFKRHTSEYLRCPDSVLHQFFVGYIVGAASVGKGS